MNSSTVKLGDIAKVFNGKTPAESEQRQSGFPVLKIRDVDENGVFRGRFDSFVDQELANQFPDKQICVKDVMILNAAHNADYVASKLFFADQRVAGALSTGEWLIIRADEEKVDPRFIHFWLQDARTKYSLRLLVKGIHLYPKDVAELDIPLPPLTEQKRIASLLARADRLRQLRRTAHDLGDALLQSVFLEMFGDMVRNDKGWKIMSLGQTCDEIYRYPTFYGFDYVEEGVPVVRIGDILMNGEVNPNLEYYVRIAPEINKRFPRTILELGDILMAVRGDGSTGKRIGIVKSKNLVGSNISPNLLRFKAKEKYVSSSFLFTFMTSSGGQELIDRYITRTAKKTITSADIQTIKIPVPPLSLQEEFAGVVARVESLRGRMGESARQVEGLFESLLDQSFRGE